MTTIGRNDPCPCGSGRKYKNCHGSTANAAAAEAGLQGAVQRSLRFLVDHHRKAFQATFDQVLEDCWPEEAEGTPLPDDADRALKENVVEWLLAEGEIGVKGEFVDIQDLLLGPSGPAFLPAQRAWIERLGRSPLRLYTVTDVRAGEGLTLVDALEPVSDPIVVRERMGSRSAQAGMLIGARILDMGDHRVLSGAIHVFTSLNEAKVIEEARAEAALWEQEEDRRFSLGLTILRAWLAQFLLRPALPEMVDASTGEHLVFVTDHYEVFDRAALEQALTSQPDIEGDAKNGWSRLQTGDDGAQRPVVTVNPGKTAERVEVFYRTQGLAERGRPWFEALAGGAVRHLTREISDPKGLFSKMPAGGPDLRAAATAGSTAGPRNAASAGGTAGLPPEVIAQAIEQALRRSYARWPDEPIPALGGKTPRHAIGTPAGLERVKGLLRSYEAKEADAAAAQARPPISYDFLWQQLGIER